MRTAARLTRYGHQDLFRIMGRDPVTRPLSVHERALYEMCLVELWNKEVAVPAGIGMPPPND